MDQGWVTWVSAALAVIAVVGLIMTVRALGRLDELWLRRFMTQGAKIEKLEGELQKLSVWTGELATTSDRLADRVRKQELRP